MNRPLISVVIPCYNYARYLGECIESVLEQSYPSVEIIVVDDGSTDETAEVARKYPGVRLIQQQNAGLAAARNKGLASSRGEYLLFLDADDRLTPRALEAHIHVLETCPDCAMSFGRIERIDAASVVLPPLFAMREVRADFRAEMLRRNYIMTPGAVLFRRSVVDTLGGFDNRFPGSEDRNYYLRVLREFDIVALDDIVVQYRKHGSNMSSNWRRWLRNSSRVLMHEGKYLRDKRLRKIWFRTLVEMLKLRALSYVLPNRIWSRLVGHWFYKVYAH